MSLSEEERRLRANEACRRYKASAKYRQTYTKWYAELKVSGKQKLRNKKKYEIVKADPVQRMKHLKKYGMTLEQYEAMHEAQKGLCAICGEPNQNNRILCVDHDHKTGKVRKLLCTNCNSKLGIYEANKDKFEAYLKDTYNQ
jgi:hypothetical protein